MKRQTIIAGNWKMNLLPAQAERLVSGLKKEMTCKPGLEVVIIPQPSLLSLTAKWIKNSTIKLGAQNAYHKLSGAFTGESSPELIKALGCQYCLAGHSERREILHESNEDVALKAAFFISVGITPIVCVGETLTERESNQHQTKISKQVKAVFNQLEQTSWQRLCFAYEPIWAIGTGKTATPDQAEEIHVFIRQEIAALTDQNTADSISILYGGSVKPANAAEILSKPNIDGLLVGGASLKADDFSKIIQSY